LGQPSARRLDDGDAGSQRLLGGSGEQGRVDGLFHGVEMSMYFTEVRRMGAEPSLGHPKPSQFT
jgi:hypothetical protein